jgi:hypothetical protein
MSELDVDWLAEWFERNLSYDGFMKTDRELAEMLIRDLAESRPSDGLPAALRALWDCGVAAGMDTDGDAGPEARVAGMGVEWFARSMVKQVEQLRADYAVALAEADSAVPAEPAMSVAMSDPDEGPA